MRTLRTLATLVAAAGLLAAQDDPAARSDPKTLLAQLEADWQKTYLGWVKAKKEAEKQGAPFTEPEPTPRLVERAWQHARALAPSEDSIPFFAWIAHRDFTGKDAEKAIDEALRAHASSERLVEVAEFLRLAAVRMGSEPALAACARYVEKSPHAPVQAKALLARATILGEEQWDSLSEAAQAKVVDDLRRARELVKEKRFVEKCDRLRFALEHLQVGKVAPEIEGKDLDEKPMKLSEFRGTVLMLDFWGHW